MDKFQMSFNAQEVIEGNVAILKRELDVVNLVNRLFSIHLIEEKEKDEILQMQQGAQVAGLIKLIKNKNPGIYQTVKAILMHSQADLWDNMIFLHISGKGNPQETLTTPSKPKKNKKTRLEKMTNAAVSTTRELGGPSTVQLAGCTQIDPSTTPGSIDLLRSDQEATTVINETVDADCFQVNCLNLTENLFEHVEVSNSVFNSEAMNDNRSKKVASVGPGAEGENSKFKIPPPVHMNWSLQMSVPAEPIIVPTTSPSMLCKIGIGLGCFATAGIWPARQEMRINVRLFDKCTTMPIPKKGVSLTLSRWVILRNLADRIDKIIESNFSLSSNAKMFEHLGSNFFVQINLGGTYVNLRKWFYNQQAELTPTRSGIVLNKDQWRNLKQVFKIMPNYVPQLVNAVPCYTQHDNPQQLENCEECSPPKLGKYFLS